MADLRKFSASLFAPAFHPSPLRLPPFGPSDSNSNLNSEDSEAETEKDWFDESQPTEPTQGVRSNMSIDEVRVLHLFFFLTHFVETIVAGFACGCFS